MGESKKLSVIITSLMAVTAGLAAGMIFIACVGKNPFVGLYEIFFGALATGRRIACTLGCATQLILTGLSFAFAFRCGLFNIGIAGQMIMGGLAASLAAAYLPDSVPRLITILIIVVTAAATGGLWSIVAGFLKARYNVHEVVSTIMMNWVAYWIVYDAVPRFICNPSVLIRSASLPVEKTLSAEWIRELTLYSTLNYGLIIALLMVFAVKFILDRSTLGFRLKAVGANRSCAEYAGINVSSTIITTMFISGVLAGLAGVTMYCGYTDSIVIGIMPSEGFNGIAVALLGSCNPVGILFSALFFGILRMASGSLAVMGIPQDLVDTVIAVIIYSSAVSVLFAGYGKRISAFIIGRKHLWK